MTLFKTLDGILSEGEDVIIVIRKKGSAMTCSVSLRNNGTQDDGKNYIQPFILTGTPQELDEGFEKEITTPLEQSSGLQTSMKEFEQAQKTAQQNSRAATEQKRKETEAAKKNAAALKGALDKAKAYMDKGEWPQAEAAYRAVLEDKEITLSDAQKSSIEKNIAICQSRDGGLFTGEQPQEEPIDIDIEQQEAGETEQQEEPEEE